MTGSAQNLNCEKSSEHAGFAETRILSDRDRDIFLSLIDAPAEPNAALREAASRFMTAVQQGDLLI